MNQKNLKEAIAALSRTLEEIGVAAQFGPVPVNAGFAASGLDIPHELEEMYRKFGPRQSVSFRLLREAFTLWAPDEVSKAQEGYRWQGTSRKVDPRWRAHWTVIAQRGGDPFMTSSRTTEPLIVGALHGQGEWSALPVGSSVAQFLQIIEICTRCEYVDFSKQIVDADLNLRDEFRTTLRHELLEVAPTNYVDSIFAMLE